MRKANEINLNYGVESAKFSHVVFQCIKVSLLQVLLFKIVPCLLYVGDTRNLSAVMVENLTTIYGESSREMEAK
jgi:hypothetical protein